MIMSREGILIIGCGISGLAAARLALRKGWRPCVTERQRTPALNSRLQELDRLGIPYETENTDRFFDRCRLAVLSPGIDPRTPFVCQVREKMPLIGELEFAYQALSQGKRLIAVTGTNGKSTTVSLIRHLLEGQGHSAAAVGNIGQALSDYTDSPHTFLVCEVSSYQLETIDTFQPETAVITNITPDHLDRYGGSFDAYFQTKLKIADNMSKESRLVINGDDSRLEEATRLFPGRRYLFSARGKLLRGAFVEEGYLSFCEDGGTAERIAPVDGLALPGAHNLENALSAVAAVRPYVTSFSRWAKDLCSFQGIEHRLEPVCEIRGVSFVNDSKGTNVDSTEKALEAFPGRKIILILGGDDAKKSDFSPLLPLLKKECRAIVLLGETTPRIRELMEREDLPYRTAETMGEAVRLGYQEAQKGDIVLLSPAAASFDMYSNFEERGRHFKEEVLTLEMETR